MIPFAGGLAVVVFMLVLEKGGAIRAAGDALRTSRASFAILGSADLDDREKERALQSASLDLGKGVGSVALRSLAAVGAFCLTLAFLDQLGWVEMSAVLSWLASWPGIVGATVVMGLWFAFRRPS